MKKSTYLGAGLTLTALALFAVGARAQKPGGTAGGADTGRTRTQSTIGSGQDVDRGRGTSVERDQGRADYNRRGERERDRGGYYYGRPYSFGWNYGYPTGSYNYDDGYRPYYGSQWNSDHYGNMYGGDGYQGQYISGFDQERPPNTVAVWVDLPSPDARVWFENEPTQQMGLRRLYSSPSLKDGNYVYTVRASWMENGREVSRTKTVPVRPNQVVTVNFMDRDQSTASTTESDQGGRGTTEIQRRDRTEIRNERADRDELSEDRGINKDANRQERTVNTSVVTGKISKIDGAEVTVTDMQGKNEHTFRVPNSAEVMIQGKKDSRDSLKPGMQVTLTPDKDRKDVISKIEAKNKTNDQGTNRDRNNPDKPRD